MRNKKLILSLLLVAAALGVASLILARWKDYVFDQDGFAISAPARPTVGRRVIATEFGPVDMHDYDIGLGDSGALGVYVSDHGNDMLKVDPKLVLRSCISGGTLISEREISLQGFPGLAWEAEDKKAHYTWRAYAVRTKVYQVLVVTPIGKPYDGTARFQNSFRLLAK
jgi:hypothetical protein